MHDNPCNGRWNLAVDAMVYEHSAERYYISDKHAAYEVTNVEKIFQEGHPSCPESAKHKA